MNRLVAGSLLAALGLALAACDAGNVRPVPPAPADARKQASARPLAAETLENPYAGQRRIVSGRVYTTGPVSARLGRHVLSFPANYYANQTGPDFQGAVTLRLRWPAMEPHPPGDAATSDATDPMLDVVVAFDVLPQSALPAALVRQVTRQAHEDPDDPRNDLSTRVATALPDGVTRYSVDPARLRRFAERQGPSAAAQILSPVSPLNDDWFVVRDPAGDIAAVIKCDPGAATQADMIGLEPVLRPGGRLSRCVHQFLVPELQLRVRMHYLRAHLPEWRDMQDHMRLLIAAAVNH